MNIFRFWKRLGNARSRSSKRPPRKRLRMSESHARIESLEDRAMMSGTPIPVTFNYSDVNNLPVYLEVSAQLTANYTTKASVTIPANTYVYYDPTISDYAIATTSSPFDFKISGSGTIVELPNTKVTAGQIVIGIGSAPIITYSSSGVSTPNAVTNPNNYFGLFEYAIKSSGVNIDMSEVDQVGFPFTITTTPTANNPADAGVGISVTHAAMLSQYTQFITAQGAAAAPFQQSLTYGNGYRLLAPQNSFPSPAAPVAGSPTYGPNGGLQKGTYYYWVTATSSTGETGPGNVVVATPQTGQTVNLTWSPFQGAVGYNIYRSTSNNAATAGLVGHTSTTAFPDTGYSQGTQHPPASGYWYNPLGSYFTQQLDNFFTHYTTNTFYLTRDGYNFSGTTIAYTENNIARTALVLTAPGLAGNFVIYEPYFSTNTGNPGLPPAPAWMPSATQPPGQMILAADGVFNTDGVPGVTGQPGLSAAEEGILADVENSIVSAFNRGIADNFNVIPNNWASEPLLMNAAPIAGGNVLTPGQTYYYIVTAEDGNGNQSTASIERAATPTAQNRTVALTLQPTTTAYAYDVYRSQTAGGGYQLITRVINNYGHPTPVTTIYDYGWAPEAPVPVLYYATGTHSNWYSAFLHQDSTTNLTSGISINSLAYGFAYDDQGAQSTDIQANFTAATVTIQPWGTTQSAAPVAQATGIDFLTQPKYGVLGSSTSVSFLARNAHGNPILGGATMTVDVLGNGQTRSYTVVTNPTTGVGDLSFQNNVAGAQVIQVELAGGAVATSSSFSIIAGFLPVTYNWHIIFLGSNIGLWMSHPTD